MAKFYTAVVTIFNKDGSLDYNGNKSVYENLIRNHSDGIVLMGSTGEFFNLTLTQAKDLAAFALKTVNHQMDVIVGASRMIPSESVELGNFALSQGADAVIVISPYYFKLSDANIENYYDQIVPNIHGPVYLYNFLGCTGYDLKPEIALRLRRKYANLKGYKDTIDNFAHTRDLCLTMHREFPDFEVYSGFDDCFVPNYLAGGSGCIGGLTNMYPELFVALTKALNEGRWYDVEIMQHKVNRMMELFEICSPFLTAVKRAMKIRGLIENEYGSSPFVVATDAEDKKIRKLLKDLDLL